MFIYSSTEEATNHGEELTSVIEPTSGILVGKYARIRWHLRETRITIIGSIQNLHDIDSTGPGEVVHQAAAVVAASGFEGSFRPLVRSIRTVLCFEKPRSIQLHFYHRNKSTCRI